MRQERRLEQAIVAASDELTWEAMQQRHLPEERVDIVVDRPNGERLRLMHLQALVQSQRLKMELIGPLTTTSDATSMIVPDASQVSSADEAEKQLLDGAVLLWSNAGVQSVKLPGFPARSVDQPSTERAVFGPKDAFVEDLQDNIGLIRRHLRDPRLRVERMTLGTMAPTAVALCYLTDVADSALVDEAAARIKSFRTERIGFVSSLLRPLFGAVWNGFLPAEFSERPYRTADFLARGRIAILADGSPFALVTPVPFLEVFIEEEEYVQATTTRYFVRALRVIAFFIALMVPGLYAAMLTVNPTIMPGLLAITVSSSRGALPYPVFTEILLLLVVFDIMAESTVTMKGLMGPTISIVGALIAGQAAIRANLASNLGVIVASITLLATFMTSRYILTYSVRLWKYFVLVLSVLFGIVGWATALLWVMANLTSQRQFGVFYLAPLAPLTPSSLKSTSHFRRNSPETPPHVRRSGSEP